MKHTALTTTLRTTLAVASNAGTYRFVDGYA